MSYHPKNAHIIVVSILFSLFPEKRGNRSDQSTDKTI